MSMKREKSEVSQEFRESSPTTLHRMWEMNESLSSPRGSLLHLRMKWKNFRISPPPPLVSNVEWHSRIAEWMNKRMVSNVTCGFITWKWPRMSQENISNVAFRPIIKRVMINGPGLPSPEWLIIPSNEGMDEVSTQSEETTVASIRSPTGQVRDSIRRERSASWMAPPPGDSRSLPASTQWERMGPISSLLQERRITMAPNEEAQAWGYLHPGEGLQAPP